MHNLQRSATSEFGRMKNNSEKCVCRLSVCIAEVSYKMDEWTSVKNIL